MSIAQALLPEFEHEMAGCRKELERVPDDRYDYKPHPRSSSLHELADHLASIPGWLGSTFTATELDFAAPETIARMPRPSANREELLARFDQGVIAARGHLAAAADEDFAVVWSGKSGGKVLFSMPRSVVYRSFIMNHLIHHRAQLGVYLRLLDQPVPAIYGPSADEAGA